MAKLLLILAGSDTALEPIPAVRLAKWLNVDDHKTYNLSKTYGVGETTTTMSASVYCNLPLAD